MSGCRAEPIGYIEKGFLSACVEEGLFFQDREGYKGESAVLVFKRALLQGTDDVLLFGYRGGLTSWLLCRSFAGCGEGPAV